jgi:hypothetical protein
VFAKGSPPKYVCSLTKVINGRFEYERTVASAARLVGSARRLRRAEPWSAAYQLPVRSLPVCYNPSRESPHLLTVDRWGAPSTEKADENRHPTCQQDWSDLTTFFHPIWRQTQTASRWRCHSDSITGCNCSCYYHVWLWNLTLAHET